MRRLLFLLLLILLMVPSAAALDDSDDTVIGTVESLQKATNDSGCTTREMELCDTVADAARSACGTDIAVMNGGDVVRNLDGGEATWGDIRSLFAGDRALGVAEISGADLLELLEHGVSHAAVDMSSETLDVEASSFDGFPQVSGFSFTYDPTAPVGERIVSAKLSDGTAVTEDMTLTLAATEYMLEGGYGYPAFDYEGAGVSQAEALARFFAGGSLPAPETGRINCIGLGSLFNISRPVVLLVSIAAILIVVSVRGALGKGPKKETDQF